MPNPLQLTFDLLARTTNVMAVDALIRGLDVPDERLRLLALDALLRRESTRGHIEITRRLQRMTPVLRTRLERSAASFGPALKQCLLHGNPEISDNALEMTGWFEDYDQVPVLLTLLEDP